MNGWFKFHRAMLDHPVWCLSPGQLKVWLTCLALANFKSGEWWDGQQRVEILPGSFITSQPNLAKAAGVTRIVVRHALKNLERIGSIRAKVRAKRWTLIEIVNWPTYQGDDDEVSQETSPRRAKGEPSVSHNVRREEGEKVRKEAIPASGLVLDEYQKRLPLVGQEVLRRTLQAIASTRKSGKVADSVLNALATKLQRYPNLVVLRACQVYLSRNCAADGKGEAYLLGIVRGEARRQDGNSRESSSPVVGQKGGIPAPVTPAATPGQKAIDSALAQLRARWGQVR